MNRAGDFETQILQIIPAPAGMVAVWRDKGGEIRVPVVCLALVEYIPDQFIHDGRSRTRDVLGMVMADSGDGAAVVLADDAGYVALESAVSVSTK
jgi:hypothetical protein